MLSRLDLIYDPEAHDLTNKDLVKRRDQEPVHRNALNLHNRNPVASTMTTVSRPVIYSDLSLRLRTLNFHAPCPNLTGSPRKADNTRFTIDELLYGIFRRLTLRFTALFTLRPDDSMLDHNISFDSSLLV